MLSRNEVWEAQKRQRERCDTCVHKPIDGYCREQMVFGEQRMDYCLDYKSYDHPPPDDMRDFDPWSKDPPPKKPPKPKRMIQI